MSKYAENTSVPVERSRSEIEGLVRRYKAENFLSAWEGSSAIIQFKIQDRVVRFRIDVPEAKAFRMTPAGRWRDEKAQAAQRDQEERRMWRALALSIKAKLEAVESKISTIEREFLAYVVMPDGRSVGDHVEPRIAAAYASGDRSALLLPGIGETS